MTAKEKQYLFLGAVAIGIFLLVRKNMSKAAAPFAATSPGSPALDSTKQVIYLDPGTTNIVASKIVAE